MSVKEQVSQALESLGEAELQELADYVAFLKFRARARKFAHLDPAEFAALYAEFADEDRCLAEEGIPAYGQGLLTEDAQRKSPAVKSGWPT